MSYKTQKFFFLILSAITLRIIGNSKEVGTKITYLNSCYT